MVQFIVVREEYWQNMQKSERRRRKVVSRSRQGFGNLIYYFAMGHFQNPLQKPETLDPSLMQTLTPYNKKVFKYNMHGWQNICYCQKFNFPKEDIPNFFKICVCVIFHRFSFKKNWSVLFFWIVSIYLVVLQSSLSQSLCLIK